jgi:hypothetical protein
MVLLEELKESVQIIQALGDNPNTDDNLSSEEMKMKFDEAARIIKQYINGTLVPFVNDLSESATKDLDPTLTREDLAAQAKAVGDAIRNTKSYIDDRTLVASDPNNDGNIVLSYGAVLGETLPTWEGGSY